MVDGLYEALNRIQALEKEVYALTKRAEHAESSVKMMRATNKDLQAKLDKKAKTEEIEVYTQMGVDYVQYQNYIENVKETLKDRAATAIGRTLMDGGFVNTHFEAELNLRDRVGIVSLRSILELVKPIDI